MWVSKAQHQLPELGWGKAPWPAVLAAAASRVGCHQLPGGGRAVFPGQLWMAGQGESVRVLRGSSELPAGPDGAP